MLVIDVYIQIIQNHKSLISLELKGDWREPAEPCLLVTLDFIRLNYAILIAIYFLKSAGDVCIKHTLGIIIVAFCIKAIKDCVIGRFYGKNIAKLLNYILNGYKIWKVHLFVYIVIKNSYQMHLHGKDLLLMLYPSLLRGKISLKALSI